jgi:hypothetical protein
MTANLLRPLLLLLAKHPLAVLRFEGQFSEGLLHSRRGINRFTLVRPHEELNALKLRGLSFP